MVFTWEVYSNFLITNFMLKCLLILNVSIVTKDIHVQGNTQIRYNVIGPQGMKGDTGSQGSQGPNSGGVTYVRWGRTTCNDTEGTEVVYTGRAAGANYLHGGGTNDYLCLPGDPEYLELVGTGTQNNSPLHGGEYIPTRSQSTTQCTPSTKCSMCCVLH